MPALPAGSVPVKVTVVIPTGKVPDTNVPKSDNVTAPADAVEVLITTQLSAHTGLMMLLVAEHEFGSALNVLVSPHIYPVTEAPLTGTDAT